MNFPFGKFMAGGICCRILTQEGCMNNLNSILIEGNLTKDPLLRSTPKGTQVCTMSLASNRYYKQDSGFEKEVSYFEIESWGRLAEACYNKGRKGRGVRVVGRLKQSRWNDADGKLRSRVLIVAEHVEFRPEAKKDAKDDAQKPAVDSPYEEEYPYEETDEPVMAMAGREVEPVTF